MNDCGTWHLPQFVQRAVCQIRHAHILCCAFLDMVEVSTHGDPCESFTNTRQVCFTGSEAIIALCRYQWSNLKDLVKISEHNKTKMYDPDMLITFLMFSIQTFYTPAQRRGILDSPCPSVRPSVRLQTTWFPEHKSSLLWNFNFKFHIRIDSGHRQEPIDFQRRHFQNDRLAAILDFLVSSL